MENNTNEQNLIDDLLASTVNFDKETTKILIRELIKEPNHERSLIAISKNLIGSGTQLEKEHLGFFFLEYIDEIYLNNSKVDFQSSIYIYQHFTGFHIAETNTELITDKNLSYLREQYTTNNILGSENHFDCLKLKSNAFNLFQSILEIANNLNQQKNLSVQNSKIQHFDNLYNKQLNFLSMKINDFTKLYANKSEEEMKLITENNRDMVSHLVKLLNGNKHQFLEMTGYQLNLNNIVDAIFKTKIKPSEHNTLSCQFYLDTTSNEFNQCMERSSSSKKNLQNDLLHFCEYKSGYNVIENAKCINLNHLKTRDDMDKSPTILCNLTSENVENVSEIIRKIMLDSLSDSILNTSFIDENYFDREIKNMIRDTSLFQKLNEIKAPTTSKARGKI